MPRTAIITSTASDLTVELARSHGVTVVPSVVTFGREDFRADVDLSVDEFWQRMLAPDAPFPITAPPSPGSFRDAYQDAFDSGADAIVSIQMSSEMSATLESARVAAEMLPDREIHLVDTRTASMGTGLLALLGAQLGELGVSAGEIARILTARTRDVHLFAALETLDYLRRGGRISGAAAQIGRFLSVKPMIGIVDGRVQVVSRARTSHETHERLVAALASHPAERLAILYSPPADAEAFRAEVVGRMPGGIDPADVVVCPLGTTIGPHIGPGCLAGVVLTRSTA